MPSIPWNVIGAGGGFALLVLIIVFGFLLKMKKDMKREKRCCDVPEVREAMKNNILTHKNVTDIGGEMRAQTKEMVKQTTLLKIMVRRANGGVIDFDL